VVVDGSASQDTVRLEVIDDGPGMTPEVLQKVGRLFFTTRGEGTGIGLYQCRRLVEGAGGNLYIASAPGQGTTITVTLRRTSEVPPTSA
jgi:two-component system, NtrC family, sensor histidine kinase HydH